MVKLSLVEIRQRLTDMGAKMVSYRSASRNFPGDIYATISFPLPLISELPDTKRARRKHENWIVRRLRAIGGQELCCIEWDVGVTEDGSDDKIVVTMYFETLHENKTKPYSKTLGESKPKKSMQVQSWRPQNVSNCEGA